MILIGIAPNESAPFMGDRLPNAPSWRGMNEDEVKRDFYDDLEYMESIIGGGPHRPSAWIAQAAKNGFEPCWLDSACGDEHCRQFMPENLTNNSSRVSGEPKEDTRSAMAKAQSKRAAKRWYPYHKAIRDIGWPIFDEWYSAGSGKKLSRAKLAAKILEKLSEPKSNNPSRQGIQTFDDTSVRTLERHITTWIREKEAPSQ
jgi:hypothetical protein